ncbi:MAG: 3-deoxy-manno-octulosonate cytidylyltransferase [Acidobacteriota bacterium]|nr:3-deoxy-manno-octulosonate cytidylyltransferase [Acidobacteriota bacterium]
MNYTGENPPTNPNLKAVAIIPARYDSVRLPGKALLEIAGKPMICWVVARALAARNVSRAIVATDDERIRYVVQHAGYEAVMTSKDLASGTDRIAEVAASLVNEEIIVNLQGDEPLVSPLTIERAIAAMGEEKIGEKGKGEGGKGKGESGRHGDEETRRRGEEETARGGKAETGKRGAGEKRGEEETRDQEHEKREERVEIVTAWEPMESAADVLNPDVVKIVVDENRHAIYFSRSPVPYPRGAVRKHGSIEAALRSEPSLLTRFRKHTGLYVYRRNVLLEFMKWPQSELEKLESLEQLRALEHGVKIKAIEASTWSIGVDTIEDLQRVRSLVEEQAFSLEFKL